MTKLTGIRSHIRQNECVKVSNCPSHVSTINAPVHPWMCYRNGRKGVKKWVSFTNFNINWTRLCGWGVCRCAACRVLRHVSWVCDAVNHWQTRSVTLVINKTWTAWRGWCFNGKNEENNQRRGLTKYRGPLRDFSL